MLESTTAGSVTQTEKEFCFDICNVMVSSNMPLTKLNNTIFKSFLQKYIGRHIPAESNTYSKEM
jgi:hypothetical protein